MTSKRACLETCRAQCYTLQSFQTQDIANESGTQSKADNKDDCKSKTEEAQDVNQDWDLYAATKGSKGNGKGSGKGKGYGECWHCGEWGHPRRECPLLQGKDAAKDSISALNGYKGSGRKGKGKKGKGGKGYGFKGKGQGNNGGGYYNYRSPGKGVEKGLNYMNDDWDNAWGTEEANNYYSDGWYGDYGDQHLGYFGNLTMLIEKGRANTKTKTKTIDVDTNKQTTGTYKTTDKCAVLEHDPLRNIIRNKPIVLRNKFHVLQNDDDADDNDEHDIDNDNDMNKNTTTIHHAPRQQTTRRLTKQPQSPIFHCTWSFAFCVLALFLRRLAGFSLLSVSLGVSCSSDS